MHIEQGKMMRTISCGWSFDGSDIEGEASVYTGLEWPLAADRLADEVLEDHIETNCHHDELPGEFFLHWHNGDVVRCVITTEYEPIHTASAEIEETPCE